ncbi:MAG: hypothetical protein ABS46_16360 [Cytophagaceae bacterium SCN 52-12]|nr:MAG: hypothetical protein ABS46_16360 [Cytophagaceae bacterium SCN 52-12]
MARPAHDRGLEQPGRGDQGTGLWLSPDQVAILPISEKYADYADDLFFELQEQDIRGFVDHRDEKIGRKIRDAEVTKIPYMLIVGEKEAAEGRVSVRKKGEGDMGSMTISEFSEYFASEIKKNLSGF